MKKSELRRMIREEIQNLNEGDVKSLKNIQAQLKKMYPKAKIKFIPEKDGYTENVLVVLPNGNKLDFGYKKSDWSDSKVGVVHGFIGKKQKFSQEFHTIDSLKRFLTKHGWYE